MLLGSHLSFFSVTKRSLPWKYQKITPRLLQKLKMKLSSVNALLEDAVEKQLKRSRVWEWLDELKDALYHAENLLDDNNTEALRRKLEEDSGTSRTSQMFKKFTKTKGSFLLVFMRLRKQ
ncbi:hypothetical protein RchiOBHm_Chr5g0045911 [Rosa chinensis]|uniref:Disease resistance N-terminal domain-containing protein n=1 Tax=Rosa chinensis TaxID=74649 RepID=A0A2P6QE03_ROSCH|nr:hypothetical protein RchiOBHm_Chr5g0045911 [Rosa chinensis]